MRRLVMASSFKTLAIGAAAMVTVGLGLACTEALHIDPPPPNTGLGGGGSGGSVVTGGGGSQPSYCDSNSDCSAPENVCDTVKHECVECLEQSDCSHKPNTVCSGGDCLCATSAESWCPPDLCVDLDNDSDNCGQCTRTCFGACSGGACADEWAPTATDSAPSARSQHVAVWTDSQMIVWGGTTATDINTNTGGVYDHVAYEWTSTSTVNAPSARRLAVAVWTGSEMIVWGGEAVDVALNTGGRFDPASNTWSPMTTANAPPGRWYHTAVWTGSEMIVWGGYNGVDELNSGASYDPGTDTWTAITAPGVPRRNHTAVWTGDRMLIYGGIGDDGAALDVYLPTVNASGGMQYDPNGDSWTSLQTTDQPSTRARHTGVLMANTMVIWGGYDGASYLPTGARYDTQTLGWQPTTAPEPEGRQWHTAVVLDTPAAMVVWGGSGISGELGTGGIYDPVGNSWTTMSTALGARTHHTAISTGSEMIVWGGQQAGNRLNDGGVFTPGS